MEFYKRLSSMGYQRPSYWYKPSSEPMVPLTIGQLIDWASEVYGDREAFVSVFQNVRWSFRDVRNQVDKLAAGLHAVGVAPGDMIAVWGFNSSYYYMVYLAAARAGVSLANLDPSYKASELLHCLRKVGAKLLVAAETDNHQDYYQIVRSLAPELDSCAPGKLCSEQLPQLTTLVLTGDQPRPGAYLLKDVLAKATPEGVQMVQELQKCLQPDDVGPILFTSGTTGKAKAVPWSHHRILNSSLNFWKMMSVKEEHNRVLGQTPTSHLSGSGVIMGGLLNGWTTIYACPMFNAEASFDALASERCTMAVGTPTMYVDLVSLAKERGVTMQYPRVVIVGGASVKEALSLQIQSVIPSCRIINIYSMTEGAPFVSSSAEDSLEESIKITGRLGENMEFKVVDQQGRMVSLGSPGELWVRGYGVMRGYWDDEENTRKAVTSDGWLRTGDIAIFKEDGRCKIVGRIKDNIIRGSTNIYPAEIEELLLSHPDVVDAQAFGVPDARWSEELCVYVRPKPGSNVDEQQLKGFCEVKVADFKVPRYVRFVDNFPKNTAGKVDKAKLREAFLQDAEFLKTNQETEEKFLGKK